MVIFNLSLLIIASFCATAQAKTCDVGVDGCSWICKRCTMTPTQRTCTAIPETPKSCEIGSSKTICGTTCTCFKAKTCKVGVDGCTWDCKRNVLPAGQATCLAVPGKPETCVIGSSESVCGTTCTCYKY